MYIQRSCIVIEIKFYSILFYSILFYSILFYSILFYSILYRHIRQAAIREFFLFAVGSHAVIIYFGWLGLALYNIVVRIMVRVDVGVRVTQG